MCDVCVCVCSNSGCLPELAEELIEEKTDYFLADRNHKS